MYVSCFTYLILDGKLLLCVLPLHCHKVTKEQFDRLFDVNVRGTFFCYKYAAIQMLEQGRGGRIIGACSIAGKRGKVLHFTF